ncbi:MAG: CHAT domain-containing protein [Gemmatimonadetes bacterium]|nr:CHAT domain-containing protein [Gemmatimonadota bacterium]
MAQQDDGILTATEIAMLPLTEVDLVVLSACETGLGETAGGEGLLDVQRAFQVAGVRSTVASLWKVPDEETRLLMERFYRNLWEEQMAGLEALREAQLWMLKNTEGLKSSDEMRDMEDVDDFTTFSLISRTSPFYWAAFQLSGDWR